MTRGVANLRTITFDESEWQVVPRELPGNMIDTINGHIDADSDAVALWRDALIDAHEPPAQQPMTDDTQRLDHLIQSGAFRVFSADINGHHTWTGVGRPIGDGATVREAIDNSIQRHHGISKGESNAG